MTMEGQLDRFLCYHRRILYLMLAVAGAITVAAAAATHGSAAWPAAFAAGSAAALVKFAFVDLSVVRKIAAGREGAATAQLKAGVASLVLFAAAAAVVVALELNVWALAAGIFCPRIILVADAWLRPNPFATAEAEPAAVAEVPVAKAAEDSPS